ncbi:hypothetical protein A1O7_02089 [Cladophialophora yegresii CBS 114405]|uniref:Uncharacterized protein n=1 Tax=Cladophialophora yegresii CBS 114405 TaxID=1182544 RepID=W9W9I7_9EURO|nr:uncharacterized protein A1O7_02089 [Cladophialophora yegresii CBS 114405]EXJ61660.1 hypothetical protein A1O7_02089 [Cladophialophora yegresii CBS 114405]
MPVTEIGCMGVKPGLDVMDDTTEAGQILTRAYKTVITASGGPYGAYWGVEIEANANADDETDVRDVRPTDPQRLWAFFDFDSVEHHEKFANGPGRDAVKDLPKILTHSEFSKHVVVAPFPPLVLLSPVTEVMLAYFPSDISRTGKDAASARFERFVDVALNQCAAAKGVACGWGLETDFPIRGAEAESGSLAEAEAGPKPGRRKGALFTAFIGWPSIAAHMAFQRTGVFKENVHLITGMEGVVSIVMFHVRCRGMVREEGMRTE